MDIIPLPAKIKRQSGKFILTSKTGILTDAANQLNAEYLRELLAVSTGFALHVRPGDQVGKNMILLHLDSELEILGREGYRLEIQPESIVIEGLDTTGVFYGIQTLRQLLPEEIEDRCLVNGIDWRVPCALIEDKPRFAWRGFMLDEARHFQGKKTVLKTLDLMALHKLNIFHWHLTDDQGWRIEIKKYPELTKVGSHRAGTATTMLGKRNDGIPHNGFYNQDEIREIVAYAADRKITVIPEVEMPGHSMAALASYPQLSCTGGPFKVSTKFGIFPDIYCAGKEAVFTFLREVLDEILDLFPSPYIHIGGDEAPKTRWKKCPDCQQRIRKEGLKDPRALQVYFTNRIAAYLASKGRQAIGWNEILQDGLVNGAVVQFWARGFPRVLKAVRSDKRAVVMSSYLNAYLDHSYSLLPLSRAYRYNPVPSGLEFSDIGCILGLEFPLWTEWVPNRDRLDYQIFPRLTAMAETGWTPKNMKNFRYFKRRLKKFLLRLDRLGVHYAPLDETEPSKVRQSLGIFTIPQPQNGTAK